MATPLKRIKSSAEELRARFNKDIQPRLGSGLYQLNEIASKAPHPSSGQPPGTRSVMFQILNQNGNLIGTAHVFVLADGSYGASGLLDPKSIRVGNTLYIIGV